MKLYIQWITDPAAGWTQIDTRDWESLPQKSPPPTDRQPIFNRSGNVTGFTGTSLVIDGSPGWINQICIQGMSFSADHIFVNHLSEYIDVYAWTDDLDDWDSEELLGYFYRFYPIPIRGTNTRIGLAFYSNIKYRERFQNTQPARDQVVALDYADFPFLPSIKIRHGIWVTALQMNALNIASQSPISWKEWIGDPL